MVEQQRRQHQQEHDVFSPAGDLELGAEQQQQQQQQAALHHQQQASLQHQQLLARLQQVSKPGGIIFLTEESACFPSTSAHTCVTVQLCQTPRTGALKRAVPLAACSLLLLQGQQKHHTSPPGQQQHTQESRNWRVGSAASLSSGTLSHAGDSMGNGLNLMGEVPLDEQPSRILYVSGIAAEVSDEELCRMFEVRWECSCCLVGPWGPVAGRAATTGASGRKAAVVLLVSCEWKGSCGPGAVLAKAAPAPLWAVLAKGSCCPVSNAGTRQLQPCGCCRQDNTCCHAGPMLGIHLLWVQHRSSGWSASLPLVRALLMQPASGLLKLRCENRHDICCVSGCSHHFA